MVCEVRGREILTTGQADDHKSATASKSPILPASGALLGRNWLVVLSVRCTHADLSWPIWVQAAR